MLGETISLRLRMPSRKLWACSRSAVRRTATFSLSTRLMSMVPPTLSQEPPRSVMLLLASKRACLLTMLTTPPPALRP